MDTLFYRLGRHFIASFFPRTLSFHIAAMSLTYMLVMSGFDWWYFRSVQVVWLDRLLFPAVVIGGLFPLLVPLMLALIARVTRTHSLAHSASALGQAALLGVVISSLYTVFTGRLQPDLSNTITDISHHFQFGFLNHGIFWGWPSSHTTIAFAMAVTLAMLYRKNKVVIVFVLLYALYIGIGISIQIHWFSDFIAGALIGTAIGLVVGTGFRNIKNGV